MIDGRFDQHFIELFAGRGESHAQHGSTIGPLLLAALAIGLAFMACLPVLT